MRWRQLVAQSLRYYWRTNAAVVAGVTVAVAVLAGALLVGDSVRGSLRDLVLQRLGRTDLVVASPTMFRADLAERVRRHAEFGGPFTGVAPLVVAEGFVTDQESGRRAGRVRVYGVDRDFWAFHGIETDGPGDREAFISPALAREIGAVAGRAILVRVQQPSEVPLESLHGRKEDVGRTLRLIVSSVASATMAGEFALDAQQGEVLAVFVPLERLQQELDVAGRVNTLLVSASSGVTERRAALEAIIRDTARLDDVGLTVRPLEARRAVDIGSAAGLIADGQAALVRTVLGDGGLAPREIFTYLANALRVGDREVPYSLVTAIDLTDFGVTPAERPTDPPPIVLNAWAARELGAAAGSSLTLEYHRWQEPGQLVTDFVPFRVAAVVPVTAGDRDLAPVFSGISESPTLADWDPPFPIDLRRIRPADEAYWDEYRTTPKAFIPLDVGQRLWRSRYGALTSVRADVPEGQSVESAATDIESRLNAGLDPFAMGLAVRDARAEGLAASRGATNFAEYFTYFSFFLVVSALLLTAMFFKLGVEQRAREVGLLRAVGLGPRDVRRLFLAEGLVLSVVGSAFGALGGVVYAALIIAALRTWWVDAVGTTALSLHVTGASIAIGVVGGVVAAAACIWWTLRSLGRISERSLLAGQTDLVDSGKKSASQSRRLALSALLAGLGVALVVLGATDIVNESGAYFGGGAALLAASLMLWGYVLRARPRGSVTGRGWRPVVRLGLRNLTHRPGRSVVSAAVIASATFILISVDAFRRGDTVPNDDRRSGVGGYQLFVESLLPIVHDPDSPEGRQALNLFSLDPRVSLEPFRLLPGDDASCLNLYEPRNPRILAPRDEFLAEGRFTFSSSLADTEAERSNPWLLLNRKEADEAIPVIADANSLTYVLHRRVGDEIVLPRSGGDVRLRVVAALADSVFQSELLMAEARFLETFPEQEGYRLLMVEAPLDRIDEVGLEIENALADLGADAVSAAERLAQFHRVENTYLSTFQTLGGLGLLLGTFGLAAVLVRNVFERRRELALLEAVGYRRREFLLMVVAENAMLLAVGLLAGAVSAAVAIAPAVIERGGRVPFTAVGTLVAAAVFVAGLLSSAIATRMATGGSVLASLRSE